ncbi:hypothetical protein HGRIS_002159 [Hohenbuehelia grisea]|uniref:Uncharacterized protein n=1 Tax=Hohenbuehelia grisea TaxID=104357 RepID=A0ABR3JKI7_9AGAR
MSSSSDSAPSTSQTPASKRQGPPPIPFANWPTIKILNPPQGRFSPKTDERCIFYCSQSVGGRYHRKDPYCRSICIRKVFTHEVRNIISFRTHHNLDAEGKAKYPLPKEGHPSHLPAYLGGSPPAHADAEDQVQQKRPGDEAKFWDEGWYLWVSKSPVAVWEKLVTMRRDLQSQETYEAAKEKRKQDWVEYQGYRKNNPADTTPPNQATDDASSSRWWGPIIPPPPIQEITADTLLIPLPPPLPPIAKKIEKLLAPTHKVLGIFQESFTSGAQKDFALRVWEKAWTKDPYILAGRAFTLLWEKWNNPSDDNDDPRDSS